MVPKKFTLRHSLFLLTLLILPFTTAITNERKEWFSRRFLTEAGFRLFHIEIVNQEFLLMELVKGKESFLQETRYGGKWKQSGKNTLLLAPDFCAVYSLPNLASKPSLLRSFDCDHLQFVLELKDNVAKLTPSMDVEPAGTQYQFQKLRNNHAGAYCLEIGGQIYFWGSGLKLVSKNQKLVGKPDTVIQIPLLTEDGLF